MTTHTRVLLINDDEAMSRLWARGLKQMGLGVVISRLSVTPRDRSSTARFSLIIIALSTSSVDGLTLCRQLRWQTRQTILLLVGAEDERLAVAAYQAGADEYIAGSISSALLAAKVTAWLRWAQPAPNL